MAASREKWIGHERRDLAGRCDLVRRLSREYETLPGMSLTADQAARTFAIRPDVCFRVFEELVEAGVLRRKWEGQYVIRRAEP